MKKSNIYILPLAVLGLLLILTGALFAYQYFTTTSINSFDECVAQGNPVMESYPAQCTTRDGKTFVQHVATEEPDDMPLDEEVTIYNPQPDQIVKSPLTVGGYVPGSWFFEGVFPVELRDSEGKVMASAQAKAEDGSDWMTEELVYFEAIIEFDTEDTTEAGSVVLLKSNPSGLPENEESEAVPVKFTTAAAGGGCMITGCSSHICSDQDQVTDCAFREEYACYKSALCERQDDGNCGWTMTDELQACLGS